MSLGRRLALPLTGILLLAQVMAAIEIYWTTHEAIVDDAAGQLVESIDWAVHEADHVRDPGASLPHGMGLVIANGRVWTLVHGNIDQAVIMILPPPGEKLPEKPIKFAADGDELLLEAALLPAIQERPLAAVVAVRSVSTSLRYYHYVWLVLLGGLLALPGGAWLAARMFDRGLQRSIDDLARRITGIGEGNYELPEAQPDDEVGRRLSVALTNMTRALVEREYRIREAVLHEPVTHLPNRAGFLEAIAPQLATERAAVLVVGLVNAQEIANTVSREVADRVLRNAATRLGDVAGNVTLGSMSDRTFAIFLPNAGELRARTVAGDIVSCFDTPFSDGNLTIDTAAAVGIALLPTHGGEGALLLRHAAVALQTAMGTDHRWAVYDHAADQHSPDRLSLMSDLRQGLERGEFMLVYQPKLHLPSNRVTAVEALIRWHHPQRGLVPTDEFVAFAEDRGIIGYLTRWALRAGIEQAARWRAEGLDIRVSINVSARDLGDARLPGLVMELLAAHKLAPDAIGLEVTESTIMTNPDAAIAVLRRLAEQNIAVSVDDFGVGRASLAYLRTLPVKELKIDRMFVHRLVDDAGDRKVVQSVVELGHSLGLAVSVEGVEDAPTFAIVAELGCDFVQGYYISRPLVPDMLVRFVQNQPPVPV
jgi:EAL domain-containing protein (putative c-di-GMP-specific phosphodiesterase class I)/GGDEF domain-containing protein